MGTFQREYLVEVDEQSRELEATRRLMGLPFLCTTFFAELGLGSNFAWYLLQFRKRRVIDTTRELGDVDILAGPLQWHTPETFASAVADERSSAPDAPSAYHHRMASLRLAQSGGIQWPPPISYLVGIEVKCAYLNPQASEIAPDAIKSTGSSPRKSRRTQGQLKHLLRMGFDRVALLDVIANPPASGVGIHAWFEASAIARSSEQAMQSILHQRVPSTIPAGHWVWSMGSVVGGDETRRGAGMPRRIRAAPKNPLLGNVPRTQQMRQTIENGLANLFTAFPTPRRCRAIYLDCRDCGHIHGIKDKCPGG